MKVALVGDAKHEAAGILKAAGFEIVETAPEFVFTYGGDGTLMSAEHMFPGTPKVPLRNSIICKKCSPLPNEEVIRKFAAGEYEIDEMWKLEAEFDGRKILGLNDIVLHNHDPRHAIRYRLWTDRTEIAKVIIGDGVVVATPFGSTAYYRSITKSFFEIGIGIAFNNSTEPFDHMVIDESRTITIRIERGPALVYADNMKDAFQIEQGQEFKIRKSSETAKVVRLV